ncbi:hypothetical protein IQ07DRAFT_131548 [Pyrenochaeta sp. DS3sAY3a]|nr:hypothetical protein IQ07DRAFT_131548 [Pyrenochaeta sp. DS3sAY3a]
MKPVKCGNSKISPDGNQIGIYDSVEQAQWRQTRGPSHLKYGIGDPEWLQPPLGSTSSMPSPRVAVKRANLSGREKLNANASCVPCLGGTIAFPLVEDSRFAIADLSLSPSIHSRLPSLSGAPSCLSRPSGW